MQHIVHIHLPISRHIYIHVLHNVIAYLTYYFTYSSAYFLAYLLHILHIVLIVWYILCILHILHILHAVHILYNINPFEVFIPLNTSMCMYILITVNHVHTDFNPITTWFCGTHRDAECVTSLNHPKIKWRSIGAVPVQKMVMFSPYNLVTKLSLYKPSPTPCLYAPAVNMVWWNSVD